MGNFFPMHAGPRAKQLLATSRSASLKGNEISENSTKEMSPIIEIALGTGMENLFTMDKLVQGFA